MKKDYAVASFNIRFDNVNDEGDSWKYRKEQILEMIDYYSWDVFGMQEVCGNQLEYIATLQEYDLEGIGREEDSNSEHGPIFYKKDIFEKEDGGTFWLSLTPDYPSKAWDADCYRICTWVRLKDKRNGKVFAFINTHLDHKSEEARIKSAQLINRWIEDNIHDIPVVLVGDFNTLPHEQCYHEFSKQLIDTRTKTKEAHYGPKGTFNNFDYSIATEDLKEIDYIFVNDQINVMKTRTIVDSFDRKYPSDHFPITATIEI